MSNEVKGTVFNVQRYTVHDGPGIRTELFLKGCPLRCAWCGNPESYQSKKQIALNKSKCIGVDICGDCINICPKKSENPFILSDGKIIGIDKNICDDCLKCYDECPSDALKIWGEDMTPLEAMEIIRKDKKFYKNNNGGVTISGGESLMQPEFVKEVFRLCKEENIHTCVETALHVSEAAIDMVMPYTDMIITDIKHLDSDIHKKYVGVGNEKVLENIKKLVKLDKPVILRIPVIPNFNDNIDDIIDIGNFILNELDNKIAQLQLLRFRPLGQEKYEGLGMEYKMEVVKEREKFEEEIKGYVVELEKMGIKAVAGASNLIEI